jgi:membrane associated rhomboid family serine protease
MKAGRVALVITYVVVTALGVWFAVASWDDANRVAAVLSALGAVAAVGTAIWAASSSRRPGGSLRVRTTGRASAEPGGKAISGFSTNARSFSGSVTVTGTGDATASGDGHAVSGVEIG